MENRVCPECNNDMMITDKKRGQITCNSCGAVLEQNCIDPGIDWRSFSEEEYKKRTRTGPKIVLSKYDKGLTTTIGKGDKDYSGTRLSPNKKAEIKRLIMWQERTKTVKSIVRNLSIAMSILDRICAQLDLTKDVKESTAYYYRKIAKKGLLRGRSIERIILATIYIVLRENKRFRSFRLFKNISEIEFNDILRYSRLIQKELNLKLPPTLPHELIPSICTKLLLSGYIETKTIILLDSIEQKINLSGKKPSGVASAALYYVCLMNNERRTQKEISTVAGITEVTLRNNYRTIFLKFSNKMKEE